MDVGGIKVRFNGDVCEDSIDLIRKSTMDWSNKVSWGWVTMSVRTARVIERFDEDVVDLLYSDGGHVDI